jgi:hypothetical protein
MRIPFPIHLCLIGALIGTSVSASGQTTSGSAMITGSIDTICIDDPTDVWSGGTMVIGGQNVIIPRNLIIELPANRMSLQQLYQQAPPASFLEGETGLAVSDRSRVSFPGFATVLANTTINLTPIAGEIFIEKAADTITGKVTYIDHTQGFIRVNGRPFDIDTGLMIRINDPDGIHTIQSGIGCIPGMPNCSPDVRFSLDPTNYTITFTTGFPAALPSTVPLGSRPGFDPLTDNAAAASDALGNGDPFAPQSNRGPAFVPDATRFAPIKLGDWVSAQGGFHTINGTKFLAAHTLTIGAALHTANVANQPDYLLVDEAEWDAPGFQNERCRMLLIGFSTLTVPILDQAGGGVVFGADVDAYSLHIDPATGEPVEYPLASTHGLAADTTGQALGANAGDVFKWLYDVDFPTGVPLKPSRSPCAMLLAAGFTTFPDGRPICPSAGTSMEEEFEIVSPLTKDIIIRSRHKQAMMDAGIELDVRDLNGNTAPWGEYLSPVGTGFPEFGEIDLNRVDTPFIFSGIPWLLDRNLGPGGWDGSGPAALDPFPTSFLDPRTQAFLPANADRVFAQLGDMTVSHDPFDAGFVGAPYPPATPGSVIIAPTGLPCATAPLTMLPGSFGSTGLNGTTSGKAAGTTRAIKGRSLKASRKTTKTTTSQP